MRQFIRTKERNTIEFNFNNKTIETNLNLQCAIYNNIRSDLIYSIPLE